MATYSHFTCKVPKLDEDRLDFVEIQPGVRNPSRKLYLVGDNFS